MTLPWDDPNSNPLADIRAYAEAAQAAPRTPWAQFWLHCEDCWAGGVWGSAVFALEPIRDRMVEVHESSTGHTIRKETIG